MRSFTSSDEAVLVLGSLNAKQQDRTLKRSSVRPVQLILDGSVEPVPFFDEWGRLGVSSLAFHPERPTTLYVTTGADLSRVELESRRTTELEVPHLRDIHEMSVIGGTLWLANTGFDEVIAFDIALERVSKRMKLAVNASSPRISTRTEEAKDGAVEVIDRFHCNQIFDGYDGELYVLVHHVTGKQLIRRIGRKLIKNQGNGGVIDLTTRRGIQLDLKGPHSVEKVGGSYWVFDSGRATVNIYDRTWVLQEKLSTRGWGRGAGVSESLGLFYAGVSATRKRYLGMGPRAQRAPNMVRIFSIKSREPVKDVELSCIEQVNNVYVISRSTALALLEL